MDDTNDKKVDFMYQNHTEKKKKELVQFFGDTCDHMPMLLNSSITWTTCVNRKIYYSKRTVKPIIFHMQIGDMHTSGTAVRSAQVWSNQYRPLETKVNTFYI